MAAARAILRHLNVSSFVVLFDETASTSMWNLTDLLSSMALVPHVSIRVDLSRNATVERLRRTLRSVMTDKAVLYRHFVVLCSETTTRALLAEASSVAPNNGALSRQFFWIFLSPMTNLAGLLRQLPPFANVLLMRNQQPACSRALSNISSAIDLASRAAAACVACDVSCYDSVRKVFQNCSFEGRDVEIIATVTGDSNGTAVTSWKQVAQYSAKSAVFNAFFEIFPNMFSNFDGWTLKIAFMPNNPWIIMLNKTFSYETETCHKLKGALIDVVQVMSEKLNFRACFVHSSDGLYGSFDEIKKQSTGMIGMVHRQEVAFAAPLTMSHSRAQVVEFSFPFTNEGSGILIRREEPSTSIFQFLFSFEWPVWLALSCAIVFVGLVDWSLSMLSPCSSNNLHLQSATKDEIQLRHNVWNSLGLILDQGQENTPYANSNRVVTASMWLFCLVMINLYSANLFTILALRNNELAIKNIEDLSNQNEIHVTAKKDTYLENIFKTSTDAVMRRINKNLFKEGLRDHERLLDMVANSTQGKMALVGDYRQLLTFEARNCSRLTVLPEAFMTDSTLAFALPKNSFYADRMNFLMQVMTGNGFIAKRFDWWFEQEIGSRCSQMVVTSAAFSPTDIWHLVGVLMVFGAFGAGAVLVFAAEKFV